MSRSIHRGLREGTARQPQLTGRRDVLIRTAPTEPEALLLWGAQREREEGKFELARGQVACDMTSTSGHHTRTNTSIELGRLLDIDVFDIGAEPRAWVWQLQSGGAWPDLPVELARRDGAIALGGLGVELAMAAIFRGIPDAPTVE
jgi:hypothetical protein